MNASHASITQGDLQDQKVADYQSALGVTRTETVKLAGIQTQSGFRFEEVDVAYQTLGTLSPARDNAILVFHALSGDARVAGLDPETGRPGWWDYHVGPGKAINTDKFFVICANVLGSCSGTTGPSSTNPKTGKPYGMDFPPITVRDMVTVQTQLLDHLGISQVFAAIGGSMGGMQALALTVDHPQRVRVCIPIATCTSHSAMQIAFNEIGRHAILNDPDWNEGNYAADHRPVHGLAVARMVGHVTYLSELAMANKFGRERQTERHANGEETASFSVESYLHHQGQSFVKRFDPNSYIYLTRAIDQFDLFEGKPSSDVFRDVRAHFLIISFTSDWLYPSAQSRELVRQLKRLSVPVTYLNLGTAYGHDSFLIDNPVFANVVRHFLDNEYRQAQG